MYYLYEDIRKETTRKIKDEIGVCQQFTEWVLGNRQQRKGAVDTLENYIHKYIYVCVHDWLTDYITANMCWEGVLIRVVKWLY